ncbi:hypothetical protein U9M48_013482 [Paspalum notatum var. saurae]|uniref:Uncharacterized protein n=1 Tax=Paspalum notatum var. saurae TaxID=547442 RepID=A0AAQ3SZF5_PASNO
MPTPPPFTAVPASTSPPPSTRATPGGSPRPRTPPAPHVVAPARRRARAAPRGRGRREEEEGAGIFWIRPLDPANDGPTQKQSLIQEPEDKPVHLVPEDGVSPSTGGIWIVAWRRVAPVASVLLASFVCMKTT